tara:strand:- start:1959 stop:2069 length:111 start_codon:yes stop_codon:yes gene_type:complete
LPDARVKPVGAILLIQAGLALGKNTPAPAEKKIIKN